MKKSPKETSVVSKVAVTDTSLIITRISSIEKSYADLALKLNSAIIISTDSSEKLNSNTINLAQLELQIIEISTQIKNLEKIILDNPEKAISIPLLKQQLDNQKSQNEKELQFTKDEIARVYDINKWIIGLVFGMLVSIVVLNISDIRAKNNTKVVPKQKLINVIIPLDNPVEKRIGW